MKKDNIYKLYVVSLSVMYLICVAIAIVALFAALAGYRWHLVTGAIASICVVMLASEIKNLYVEVSDDEEDGENNTKNK